MICKKCVLPESKPDIWLNEEGVCNICVEYQLRDKSGRENNRFLETDLVKILNKYRGKGKYDCLVMCSGGKDSTISLYYMKKKYRMNPLAFTFDHGFENEAALENIRNAVRILEVDWIYFKSDFMKDAFAKLISCKSPAPICHVCAIWYLELTLDIAARHNIPLLVAGWTKGQANEKGEDGKEYAAMSKSTSDFVTHYLNSDPKYRKFPKSIKGVLSTSNRKFKSLIISPHWFIHYDQQVITETLQKELQWKAPGLSYPKGSTNCLMNFASVYFSMKNYGYTHYHVEMSKLIRKGELSREEALEKLKIDFGEDLVNPILKNVGCSLED